MWSGVRFEVLYYWVTLACFEEGLVMFLYAYMYTCIYMYTLENQASTTNKIFSKAHYS